MELFQLIVTTFHMFEIENELKFPCMDLVIKWEVITELI